MVISMMKQDLKAVRIARRIQGSERRWLQRISARQWSPFRAILLSAAATAFDKRQTVAVMKKKIGIDPAVGSDLHRRSTLRNGFRVRFRKKLYRTGCRDGCSLPDDDTVSRESHALVTYDVKHNTFSLSPGQGRGIPTATMNRSKWFIRSKHTTSSRSEKKEADCFSCLFAANSFSGVRNSSCSFLKAKKAQTQQRAIRTSTGVALRYHRSDPGKNFHSGNCKPAGARTA